MVFVIYFQTQLLKKGPSRYIPLIFDSPFTEFCKVTDEWVWISFLTNEIYDYRLHKNVSHYLSTWLVVARLNNEWCGVTNLIPAPYHCTVLITPSSHCHKKCEYTRIPLPKQAIFDYQNFFCVSNAEGHDVMNWHVAPTPELTILISLSSANPCKNGDP